MKLNRLVPALAIFAAIPATQAFEIAGDGWTFAIEPRIQTRVEIGAVSDAAGDDADAFTGSTTDDPQAINFQVRRARLYMKGKSDTGWSFAFTLNNDKIARKGGANGSSLKVQDAYVGKKIKSGDMSHYIQFGFDEQGDFGSVAVADSSAKKLFPNGRLSAKLGQGSETVGFGYKLSTEMFGLTASISEGEDKTDGEDDAGDMYFAVRAFTGLGNGVKKRTGSFLGKEGFEHEAGVSLDYYADSGDEAGMVIMLDYLVHYNEHSGLLEFGMSSWDNAGGDSTDGSVLVAQYGYAMALASGMIIEPAIRLTMLDKNSDLDEAGMLTNEGGDDGMYLDIGLNQYLDGHNNKLQYAVQYYSPEEEDGTGLIFRIQHQLEF